MARCEPRVSCINIKKISKITNISQFGLEQKVRERERGGKKKASFSGDFTRFYRSELGRPRQRVKTALRDESYRRYQNHKISPRSKVRVFTKTEKRRCLGNHAI